MKTKKTKHITQAKRAANTQVLTSAIAALDLAAKEACRETIRHHLAALEAQREAQHLDLAIAVSISKPDVPSSTPTPEFKKCL
jgi:hypothetical protein